MFSLVPGPTGPCRDAGASATGAVPAVRSRRADPAAAAAVGVVVVGVDARPPGTLDLSCRAARHAPVEHAHLRAGAGRRAVATVTAVGRDAGVAAAEQPRRTSAQFVDA